MNASESQDLLSPGMARLRVGAVVSLLHEPPGRGSAHRLFRGEPVLRWTLRRLNRSQRIDTIALLSWDDQQADLSALAEEAGATVISQGPRTALPRLAAITAARCWSDGWRGGLLGTCDFDLGFHAPAVRDAAVLMDAEAVLLIDPASALVDAALLDGVINHAERHADLECCFAPAAPGLCGPLLRRAMIDRLLASASHPGRMLHYHPDTVSREPLAGEACAPIPTPVARTLHRFDLGSDRQSARIRAATKGLNGQLISAGAEELVRLMNVPVAVDSLPRDIVLELNTRRLSQPIYWPGRSLQIHRPDLPVETARRIIDELATCDGTRLTLAGVGDPLLSDGLLEVIEAAVSAGLAVNVETDLLGPDLQTVRQLAASGADVVSIHLPAVTEQTYTAVMGLDGYRRALEGVEAFVSERAERGRGLPILTPLFTKCASNLHEMERWYDLWLSAVGSAAIVGPSDYAGQISDVAVADMAPPRRHACSRLASRLTILSNGMVVSCEQDVLGRQVMGTLQTDSLKLIWQRQFGALRSAHASGQWSDQPLCAGCREWHRP